MTRKNFLKIEEFRTLYIRNNKKNIMMTENKTKKDSKVIGDNYGIIGYVISDELEMSHVLSEDGISYVERDSDPKIATNLKNGKWKIQAKLDLHGFRSDSARDAINKFIYTCHQKKMRCVSIIHGKGYGSINSNGPILKRKVPSWLVQIKDVQAFSEASENEGGSGAVVILLKQRKQDYIK